MIDIILTIVTFSSMLVLFKYFEKFHINNLQAIIINYITAGTCGIIQGIQNGSEISFKSIVGAEYTLAAIIIGFMFIFTFNLIAFGTQKIGIAITTVSNKMSMVIPVAVSFYFFNDHMDFLKFMGILLSLVAIYYTSTNQGKLSFNKKYLWLIAIIFFGQGIADSTLKWAQVNVLTDKNIGNFFASTFFMAAVSGLIFLVYQLATGKNKLKLNNVLAGIILGLPNYFTLYFFMRAMDKGALQSSQLFPVVNMGVIVFSAILGIVLFREKLSKTNWLGIAIAIVSITFITFSVEILSKLGLV